MSWWNWQSRLLPYAIRYGLLKSGFLDEHTTQDLANFDISLGSKKSIIELKNVGLNISRISQFARLPPSLHIESARIQLLRFSIVREGYQPNIELEIEGIEVIVSLQEESTSTHHPEHPTRLSRTSQHRKATRRLHSPPPSDPGGTSNPRNDVHIPTTEEMARSFVLQEPPQMRKEMAASVAGNLQDVEESFVSESSENEELGTGVANELPGFLSNILEGVLNRAKFNVKGISLILKADIKADSSLPLPIELRAQVGSVEGEGFRKPKVTLRDIAVDLICDETVASAMSEIPLQASPVVSRAPTESSSISQPASSFGPTSPRRESIVPARRPSISFPNELSVHHNTTSDAEADMQASYASNTLDAALPQGGVGRDSRIEDSRLDIRAGDDTISWTSRRSHTNASPEGLWNSMVSDDELSESQFFERASVASTVSPRGTSPISARIQHSHTSSSPRSHGLRSWPRATSGSSDPEPQQNPVSRPTSRSDIRPEDQNEQLEQDSRNVLQGEIDNRARALALRTEQDASPPLQYEDDVFEDMAESRVFSHQEAESMYMSALSGIPSSGHPDGHESNIQGESLALAQPANALTGHQESLVAPDLLIAGTQSFDCVTPRGRSPAPAAADLSMSEAPPKKSTRTIVFIDMITLAYSTANVAERSPRNALSSPTAQASSRDFPGQGMPGAFSIYSDMSRSRHGTLASGPNLYQDPAWQTQEASDVFDTSPSLDVNISAIKIQVDPAVGRCLYGIGLKAMSLLRPTDLPFTDPLPSAKISDMPSTNLAMTARIELLSLAFRDQCVEEPILDTSDLRIDSSLFVIAFHKIKFEKVVDTSISIGDLVATLGGQNFLTLGNDEFSTASSTSLDESASKITLKISHDQAAANGRSVILVKFDSAPLHLHLDLNVIDNTFSSFGGLSAVLEIGSTVISDSATSSPVSSNKSTKGVRFIGDSNESASRTEVKIAARINGAYVRVTAPSCDVTLRSTAIKIKVLHRELATQVSIDEIVADGPHADRATAPSVCVNVAKLRMDYSPVPNEEDLERLLSLLTPSNDKYDRDDDILVDTLLRQRRKGAVFRAQINDARLRIDNWECLSTISTLINDLSKFSAVAKYLPEDDRPGVLSLLRIKVFEAQLPINDRFGPLRVILRDVCIAHIGLPALLAFSIDSVKACPLQGPDLIHAVVTLPLSEASPAVLARMLGDEEEPVIKIKLSNICLEYSVDVLLSLVNSGSDAETQHAMAKLAQSIAELTNPDATKRSLARDASDVSDLPRKRVTVSLLIHDSAIGLTPQRLPSKALLVLSDAHFTTKVPIESTVEAKIELRRAQLFVTDAATEEQVDLPTVVDAASASQRLASALAGKGFVSVGSIRSAIINIIAEDGSAVDKSKTVDVLLRNELFLLETCADSTATLIATLAALAPPSQPNEDPKYLTQPMTIEDMMASFTGETVEDTNDSPPETLFDVDDVPSDGMDSAFDAFESDYDTQGLFAESEMSSSLYGPVSRVFDMDEEADNDTLHNQQASETIASLLDEDPFEMTEVPADVMGSAHLLRELDKQRLASSSEDTVHLEEIRSSNPALESAPGRPQARGNSIDHGRSKNVKEKPTFRLRLQDCHLIWQLYDGYDWQRTRSGIIETVERVEMKAEEKKARKRQSLNDREDDDSVIGDFLFNSIYIGVPSGHDAQELRRAINRNIDDRVSETESVPVSGISRPTSFSTPGQNQRQHRRRRLKLGRSGYHKIAFELSGVSGDFVTHAPGSGDVVSTIKLRLRDFEIFDNVPTSTWRKFLTHVNNDPKTREMFRPMFDVEVQIIKTLESHSASELALHVSTLPLRLHVDQDALDFITRFFAFKDPSLESSDAPSDEPFIQRLEIDTIDMWLDYKPKHIDFVGLRSGKTTEFMNFIGLDASHIRLKHAIVYGLRGFDKIHPTLNDIWMQDVRRNQLPTVIAGLAPVRSLVNLSTGIRDVVAIPVREYRKDGRIVRSIQKGAFQFGKTTAAELARLGAKVALGTQTALSTAEQMLSPPSESASPRPSIARRVSSEQGWHDVAPSADDTEQRAVSAYANQPLGVLAGLRTARRQLEHDLLTMKDALIAVQGEIIESSGPSGAAAAVARHAPTVLLRPVIGATRAMGTALLGVGNQIDRANLKKLEDKYKSR